MFWLTKNSTTPFIYWEMRIWESENMSEHVAEITGNWRKASSNHCQLPLRCVIFYNKLCVVQSQWPHKTHPDVHKPGGYIAVGVAAIIWNVLSIITCKVNAKSTRGIMLPNISLSLFKLELKNWSCATSLTTTAALWYLLCTLCWYTKQQCVQPLCTRLQKAADAVTYFSHLWKLEPKCRWPVSFDRICCLIKKIIILTRETSYDTIQLQKQFPSLEALYICAFEEILLC